MRRREDSALVLNEVKLLLAAVRMLEEGASVFHGYEIARYAAGVEGSALMSQGALYRALRRLEERGALESWWEDQDEARIAGREGRLRRYYRITERGAAMAGSELARAQRGERRPVWVRRWGEQSSL